MPDEIDLIGKGSRTGKFTIPPFELPVKAGGYLVVATDLEQADFEKAGNEVQFDVYSAQSAGGPWLHWAGFTWRGGRPVYGEDDKTVVGYEDGAALNQKTGQPFEAYGAIKLKIAEAGGSFVAVQIDAKTQVDFSAKAYVCNPDEAWRTEKK